MGTVVTTIILILVILGVVGWLFYRKFKNKKEQEEKDKQERDKKEQEKIAEEEESKRREEKSKKEPCCKSLEWFSSKDGLKAFDDYCGAQNYIYEDSEIGKALKESTCRWLVRNKTVKEWDSFYNKIPNSGPFSSNVYDYYVCEIDLGESVSYEKMPFYYFGCLAEAIVRKNNEINETEMAIIIDGLEKISKPFWVDEQGKRVSIELFTKEFILSVNKNPILNYSLNIKCLDLGNKLTGEDEEKVKLFAIILDYLYIYMLNNNSKQNEINLDFLKFIFDNDTYFDEFGIVKKEKIFLNDCFNLTKDDFFKKRIENCD